MQNLFSPEKSQVVLENPISSDMGVMRSSILSWLVSTANYNLKRQQERIKLFETGLGFYLSDGEIIQEQLIGGVLVGSRWPETWLSKKNKTQRNNSNTSEFDFYDLKYDVDNIVNMSEQEI